MAKAFLYGFLVGIILAGVGWYAIGRNDIGAIRADYDRAYRDFEEVQRDSGKLESNAQGFARDITVITETSKRIDSRAERIEEGFAELDGGLGLSVVKVDELERDNIKLIRIGRNIGDLSSELREINRNSREEE